MQKSKIKFLFIILPLISILLIITHKLRPLDYTTSETTFQALNYLHELEISNVENCDLYNNGMPVLLGRDVPNEEKLEITIKNKFINIFTNDLNLLMKNNTGQEISVGESILDGLEVYQDGKWIPLSIKQNASVDAISHNIPPDSSIVYSFTLNKYFLKEGRYRVIIGYYNDSAYIVDSIEFIISGLF